MVRDVQPAAAGTPDDAELRAALEVALARYGGRERRIQVVRRLPSQKRSSLELEELDLTFEDGSVLPVMFKDLNCTRHLEQGRWAKPDFICDPLREIMVYHDLLGPSGLQTAACYGSVVDPPAGRYWLFLEKVRALELYQAGFETWLDVARWLARMHGLFRTPDMLSRAEKAHALLYSPDYYRRWLCRARQFLCHDPSSQSAERREMLDWLAHCYEQVVEYLGALPTTFIHGEFYASNVLVQERDDGTRICPVDWEMAAVGPGLFDLAALAAGSWSAEQKQALALAYQAAVEPSAGWPPALQDLLTALDYGHLHLAVQWMGWSTDPGPAPHKGQDWLTMAVGLAEKLGL